MYLTKKKSCFKSLLRTIFRALIEFFLFRIWKTLLWHNYHYSILTHSFPLYPFHGGEKGCIGNKWVKNRRPRKEPKYWKTVKRNLNPTKGRFAVRKSSKFTLFSSSFAFFIFHSKRVNLHNFSVTCFFSL